MVTLNTREVGSEGELLASEYLRRKGYVICTRNWTCRYGELDLITYLKNLLVFIEVKYVKSPIFCSPVELFTLRKRKNVYRTIQIFLSKYPKFQNTWRFDLVCITLDAPRLWVEHYKNAFSFNDG